MKKLMTMLAAVAMSFGLFAEDVNPDAGFISGSNMNDGTAGAAVVAGDWWAVSDTTQDSTYTAWPDGASITCGKPLAYSLTELGKFVTVKTGSDKPLYRNIIAGGTAKEMLDDSGRVYFDGNVKFTAFDATDTISAASDAKIALWVQATGDDSEVTGGKLMVRAAYWDGLTATSKDYVCQTFATEAALNEFVDAWHRISIKTIDNMTTGATKRPAFVIQLDGARIGATEATVAATVELTTQCAAYNIDSALFPSLVQSGDFKTTVSSVGVAGQGGIDNFAFTTTAPEGLADQQFFTLAKGENVTEFKYSTDNVIWETLTADKAYVNYNGDTLTVTVKDIVCASGYIAASAWGCKGNVQHNGSAFVVSGADAEGTVLATEANVTLTCKVDGEDMTISGADIADVLGKLPEGATDVKVKLDKAVTTATAAAISGTIVLDLNNIAYTYTGDGYAFTVANGGALTITDTSVDKLGSITSENGVVTSAGSLSIDAGTFNGAVAITAGAGDITGGTFEGTFSSEVLQIVSGGKFKADPKVYVKTGLDTELKEGYYEIVPATYTITYYDDEDHNYDEISGLTPTKYTYNQETLTLGTPEDETGRTFVKWLNMSDDSDFVYTKGMTGYIDVYAVWAAKTFAVTLNNGQNSTIATDYEESLDTVPYDTEMTITAKADTDYEFAAAEYTGWTKVDNSMLTKEIRVTDNVAITAPDATAKQTIPYTPGVGGGSVTPTGTPGVYIVAGDESSHSVNIVGGLKDTDTIIVNDAVTAKIIGVPANQIKVVLDSVEVDKTAFIGGDETTGYSLELNPATTTPEIEESASLDIAAGKIACEGIAGLFYSLVKSDEVAAVKTQEKCIVSKQCQETGTEVELQDKTEKGAKAFYLIKVGKAPMVLED